MLNPLYIDLKIDKDAVAGVAKFAGFWATIAGGIVGGLFIVKIGIHKLWSSLDFAKSGLLLFAYLASFGQQWLAANPTAVQMDTVTILHF